MFAAISIGAALTLLLLISPSSKVNANKTSVPLVLDTIESVTIPPETVQATNEQTSSAPLTEQEHWDTFTVNSGDTLSHLFAQAGFNDKTMYQVLGKGNKNKELTRIYPGEKIAFSSDEATLKKVKLIRSPLESYVFSANESGDYVGEKITREPEVHTAYAEGTIDSSLFLAGQKAGLSQTQIMELANIFGWDIDFVLDIRSGDQFSLVYEELFLDGEKYKNGRILAASFTNQKRKLDAVLYEQADGISNYYTPEGNSMRKAFLRTPVDFARISSHFNLKRKHPILHKIRAHKGTDYAASRGTPIKASGDGKVIHAGRKGGYGKTVIIQHGQKFTTLYAHMSKFARGVRTGKRVKQGQVIGYVGSTGLASGPHLHYEFRVNGVHKNPVRVKLPHAKPIPQQELNAFREKTSIYLAQLATFQDSYRLAAND
ncbi:MAG: peptidase M23 [Oleiphilus sp.]|nr:MAG: peptidase M23 [Oleiphilus sp.]